MIEIPAKAIDAIVTVAALRPIRLCMRRHVRDIDLAVADIAGVGSEGCDVAVVTVITGERFACSRELVPFQRETHHLMREVRLVHDGKGRFGSTMFGMTVLAAKLGIIVQQSAVHGCSVSHLPGDLCVTNRTAVRHAR